MDIENKIISYSIEWWRNALECGCHPQGGYGLVEQYRKELSEWLAFENKNS